MNHRPLVCALALMVAGGMALSATLSIPDVDTFSTAGSPPAGWRVATGSGTWTSDGSALTAGVATYSLCGLYRGASGDTYTYATNNPLAFSVDMQPGLGNETSHAGFSFLCKDVTPQLNGGRGYSLHVNNGSSLSLQLSRDVVQWDGGPVVVGSASLSRTAYNSSLHNYKVVVTFVTNRTATLEVFVDNASVISYTDTNVVPMAVSSTNFIVALENAEWPGYGTTKFDNWRVEYLTPEPAVNNASGATNVTTSSAWLNGTLTKTGNAETVWGIYWGTNDPGKTTSGWSEAFVLIGTNTLAPSVTNTVQVTGLAEGRRYYYRYYATNAYGVTWADPAAAFTTLVSSPPPVILNADATNVTTASVFLRGYLQSTGTTPTTVSVCWGEHNGAMDGAWEHTNAWPANAWAAGQYPETNVTVAADRTYYYAFVATNDGGTGVASPPASFITGGVTLEGTANGSEAGPTNGQFTVCRPAGCTNEALVVNYIVDAAVPNAASNGVDYAWLSGSVTLPAGAVSTTITVQVMADAHAEANETVKLVLANGCYVRGIPGEATISIANQAGSGADVWWRDRDGNTGARAGIWWSDLQDAVQQAQAGSAGTGLVRLCGSVTRTNLDTIGQIAITNGGHVRLSGGWTWNDGAEPVVQNGRSVLDANSTALSTNKCRVVSVGSSDVTLQNLDLTGGYATATPYGAGILCSGASRLTLENVVVRNNTADTEYMDGGGGIRITGGAGHRVSNSVISNNVARVRGWGGGLYLDGTTSMLIENSVIVSNVASASSFDGNGGAIELINNAQLFLANCRISDNRCAGGGSAIHCATATVGGGGGVFTAYGCLFTGNRHATDPNGTRVDVIRSAQLPSAGASRLANCTVVSNYGGGITAVAQWSGGHFVGLQLLNSIIQAGALQAQGGDCYGSSVTTTHLALQNTTVQMQTNQNGYGMAAFVGGAWQWSHTNTLAQALAALDAAGSNRFHSLTAGNTLSQALETNLEGDPGLLTDPLQLRGRPLFSLADNSTCFDSGINRAGSGFAYVDVNNNASYDALVDVIVSGMPPAGTNYVYATDLAGSPRLKGAAIDRGCYETQSRGGTVVLFR